MQVRLTATIMGLTILAGCQSGPAAMPDFSAVVPRVDWGRMALPKGKVGQVLMGESTRESFSATRPVALQPGDQESVRAAVGGAFPAGWKLKILTLRSGVQDNGVIASCGLASAANPNGGAGWSGIYRVDTDPFNHVSRLQEIAGNGSDRVIAYSHCQALDLI